MSLGYLVVLHAAGDDTEPADPQQPLELQDLALRRHTPSRGNRAHASRVPSGRSAPYTGEVDAVLETSPWGRQGAREELSPRGGTLRPVPVSCLICTTVPADENAVEL
jgi:hypothetical protein